MKTPTGPAERPPNLAGVAALIGDPVRAALLFSLLHGGAVPATELASRAGASPQAASAHLHKLVNGGLLSVTVSGRQRLYQLAGHRVAEAIETLVAITSPPPIVSLSQSLAMERLRAGRTCYDHLAGRLGVGVTDGLIARGSLRLTGSGFDVPPRGERFYRDLGVDVPALRRGRRVLGRACIDWIEHRPHLAGSLGKALLDRFLANAWIARSNTNGDRSVQVTERGRRAIGRLFGVKA